MRKDHRVQKGGEHLSIESKDLGDNDFFICPRCGHRWEETLSPTDYDSWCDEYRCPECGFDQIRIDLQTDYWYEQSTPDFAEKFLRLRGYQGKPESWYAVGCYLERFLNGNREIPTAWAGQPSWDEARKLLIEYFDKPPYYEYVICKGCGKKEPKEETWFRPSDEGLTARCQKCGDPDKGYMHPCEIVKEVEE